VEDGGLSHGELTVSASVGVFSSEGLVKTLRNLELTLSGLSLSCTPTMETGVSAENGPAYSPSLEYHGGSGRENGLTTSAWCSTPHKSTTGPVDPALELVVGPGVGNLGGVVVIYQTSEKLKMRSPGVDDSLIRNIERRGKPDARFGANCRLLPPCGTNILEGRTCSTGN